MPVTDADITLAASIFHPGFGMDCVVIADKLAAHRTTAYQAGLLAGAKAMQEAALLALRPASVAVGPWPPRNMNEAYIRLQTIDPASLSPDGV